MVVVVADGDRIKEEDGGKRGMEGKEQEAGKAERWKSRKTERVKGGQNRERNEGRRRAGWREKRNTRNGKKKTRCGKEERRRRRKRTEGEEEGEETRQRRNSCCYLSACRRPQAGPGYKHRGCPGSPSTEKLTVGQGPAGWLRRLQLPMLGDPVQPPMLWDPVPEAPPPCEGCFSPPYPPPRLEDRWGVRPLSRRRGASSSSLGF